MIHNLNFIDRLYLSQSKEDCIYIDDNTISQTSFEGVRFIFKQFTMRKCGVILNDAYRFARNIQVCLFLKAVRPLLTRPALLLCEEGSEQSWLDRFDTWCTKLISEVAIETVNPYIKKMVIINTMVNLHKFCEREWSIIIVDGDHVTKPNPILKLPFKTCFKIWNTQINMKENLDKFEEVYKWIFPREIFDKHFFIPEPGNAVDVVEKSILLDSFFEEIVLRKNESDLSHKKYIKKNTEKSIGNTLTILGPNRNFATMTLGNTTIRPAIPAPKKTPMIVGDTIITRTAVDPTAGSCRMVGDTTITPSTGPSTAISRTIGDTTITSTIDTIMSVCDTSITSTSVTPTSAPPTKSPVPTVTISRKNKDATGTKIKRSKPKIEPENVPAKLFESPIAVLAKLLEESPKPEPGEDATDKIDYCIENFNKIISNNDGEQQSNAETSNGIKTEELIEITELAEKPDATVQASGDKLVEMDTLVFGHDTLISQVLDTDTPGKGNITASDKKEIEPHTILTCKPVGDRSTHNNKSFADNNKSTSPITFKTSGRCSENTERDEKNDRKRLKGKSLFRTDEQELDIIKIDLDELNREMRELATRDIPERSAKRQKTAHSSETATCYNGIKNKFHENHKETSLASSKITEQLINSLKRNNIDVKMKECEETVSKKFKGTLLDSLF